VTDADRFKLLFEQIGRLNTPPPTLCEDVSCRGNMASNVNFDFHLEPA
jgi:hypothetical protein